MILVRKAKSLELHVFYNNSISELITDQIPKSSAKSQSSSCYSGSQKVESGKTKGSDTVDLTISDSDDDVSLKNVPVSKNSLNSNQTKTKSVNGMSF